MGPGTVAALRPTDEPRRFPGGSPRGKLGSHRKHQQFFQLSDSSLLKHPHAPAEEAGTATFRMTFKNQGCAADGH